MNQIDPWLSNAFTFFTKHNFSVCCTHKKNLTKICCYQNLLKNERKKMTQPNTLWYLLNIRILVNTNKTSSNSNIFEYFKLTKILIVCLKLEVKGN